MYKIEIAENGVQATDTIRMLQSQGFNKEAIYIFAHDKDRSEHLSDATDTGDVGMKEQGFFDSVGNVFKKRGDELRSKFESVGLTKTEAEQYEKVLDEGKLVIVGTDEVK
ncbi:general stress protein [Cytobacillus sp. NCCP-133]|uniref:general stress protein n=1 Tax=Cytobacillus sp. NCCP-133 TaxID=766848 RepID=UPI00223044E9|nr:general stress protein [Cytobacillus sp. NCCP-133]GLB59126.1 general stress protein 17M [Cytobacillus sp. NCCP-133]